jgi:SAM-dependent methyltransferase
VKAICLNKVEIVAFYLREAGEYRFDWKLAIAVNYSDILATTRVESAAHVPSHCPFFWFGQHTNKRQPFCKPLTDFRRPIIRAWSEICHQKQFPFKAKQRHYFVKVLYEWNDFFFRAMTKDRNGKLDGRFDHCIQRRSSQSHDLGQLCRGTCFGSA